MSKESASGLVLTFHGIARSGDVSRNPCDTPAARYRIPEEVFEQILVHIADRPTCAAAEFASRKGGSWFVLTFDDGFHSDFAVATPMLTRLGIRGTFFITMQNVGRPGFVTWEQMREMAAAGMEIASHGLTHRYLVTMSRDDAVREIRESKTRIEDELGRSVESFAPVGGHFRGWMVAEAAEAGYRVFATMIPGETVTGMMPTLLRRNHIQSHHDAEYISRLLSQDRKTLLANRLRYSLLRVPKVLLGLRAYDHLKNGILGAVRHPTDSADTEA